MKIVAIDTIPVQVPIEPRRAIRSGRGAHTTSPFLLVQIQGSPAEMVARGGPRRPPLG